MIQVYRGNGGGGGGGGGKGVKIVFALPFKDNVVSGYSLPEVGIKDHNVMIDGRTL